ncbi:hypothetical protein IC229_21960 [Spirosoma sp. BT702]|uniref:Lipoprotein n=1 Tax=Spirosoma profusum TaxID=2771354 RepID=A0A926Y4N5_9BACT|nr:hypothetical protein [Spirosoma profusum]MBD2703326.1 hypothetical protein [Spirosoma profusum]
MRFIQAIVLLFSGCFGLACEQQKCQAPPPTYNVAFVNSQGQPLIGDPLQADAVHIWYTSSTGVPIHLPKTDFKAIASNDSYKFIYNVGYDLFARSEQTQYTVALSDKVLGTLSMTSRRNESKCNGWMHLTGMRFNNEPVSLGADNVTYVLKVN